MTDQTEATYSAGAERILEAAESMVRTRGYNGVSFREIATEVGIKSSSVHYHFPTKADLGTALAQRYTERVFATLGDPTDQPKNADAVIKAYRRIVRTALVDDQEMCLAGMLGAEVGDLPDDVADATAAFFAASVDWLTTALRRTRWGKGKKPKRLRRVALTTIAALEGGLILARTLDDPAVFDDVRLESLEA